MNSVKEKLIAQIKANEDEALLNELYNFLISEEQQAIQFTEEQKSRISESQEQYKTGKTVSNKDIQNRMDKWLGK